MEKVNGRRGFLKGFGIGGVVLGGAASGYLAATREIANVASTPAPAINSNVYDNTVVERTPDIAHLAPKQGATSLMITGDNRPPPPPVPAPAISTGSYTLSCSSSLYPQTVLSVGSEYTNKCPDSELNRVAMAVGKDNRLWIKVGDSWKRVMVEG